MKGTFAVLMWILFFSPAFGQETAGSKHPEQEWNFLFTNIDGENNNYRGFSFMKSNYAKTQYLGLSFYMLNDSKVERSEDSFSFTREIDTVINGYVIKDTIKIDGREETIKKTSGYIFGLDLRFLPEKWRVKRNYAFFGDVEGGFFWGGGVEVDSIFVTQKTTLYFRQENGGLNTINFPTLPASISFDWGPYLIFGAFGNVGRLTVFTGVKKVYNSQNRQLSLASNIGIKF